MALFIENFLKNNLQMYESLILNAIILTALVAFYSVSNLRKEKQTVLMQVFRGILVGITAVLIMSKPWEYGDGIIYDARSIVYIISGTYYGFIPTLIALVLGITFRIVLGGAGVIPGVVEIIIAAGITLLWPFLKKGLRTNKLVNNLMLTTVVHVLVLLLYFIFPVTRSQTATLVIPFLIIFPVISIVLSMIIEKQTEYFSVLTTVKNQTSILNASINSIKNMQIFVVDSNYRYIAFNQYHSQIIEMYLKQKIDVGDCFLSIAQKLKIFPKIKDAIDIAMTGTAFVLQGKLAEMNTMVEAHYNPVLDKNNEVIGATIFVRDITEQKRYENEIIFLSNRDGLTKIYNRRFFENEIKKLDHENIPFVLLFFDINGLKLINDTFGHGVGDLFLLSAAQKLDDAFSQYGFVARIGGDEFIAVITELGRHETLKRAEKIKEILSKTKIKDIGISISYGVAIKDENVTIEEALKEAEDKMYKYKFFEAASHRNENIKTILNVLRAKNYREEMHSHRVAQLCSKIGEKLNMPQSEINLLTLIANLHDIGKIGIDEQILNKPGPLTESEYEMIKRHPEIGFKILSTTPEYSEIAHDVLAHHERYDGTGYPNRLKGEEIPIRARIISVVDSFDAMMSDRPYRKGLDKESAIQELIQNKGTQFDPDIVGVFLEIISN